MTKPTVFNYNDYLELKKWADSIVRCQDCKRWTKGDDYYGICQWNDLRKLQTPHDGFCHNGERRKA